jgi:hypothetical protein
MSTNRVGTEGNKDTVSKVTEHNPKASVGGFMLDMFLDNKHYFLEDTQSTTQGAMVV